MAVKYLRLFDPTQQFQLKGGQLNVAGRLYVHYESTDDLADLYDENGTQLTQPVILDNNGRAAGLFVDSSKVYWLDVQDQFGMSQFTIRKMTPSGGGGGANLGTTYDLVSSDGSIAIDMTTEGNVTTYDLTRPDDSTELLEWIRCDGATKNSDTYTPIYTDGTMEVGTKGIKVYADRYYHVTAHVRASKSSVQPYYDKVDILFRLVDDNNVETNVIRQSVIVDSSVGLVQDFEVSTDVKVEEDAELILDILNTTVPGITWEVLNLEAHRVFSGAPVVPGGVANKPWVEQNFQPMLTAGENIQISSENVISATDTTYTAGTGLSLSGTEFSVDTTTIQEKLTAGSNIVIEGNTISATAEPQLQANWNETDTTSVQYIQNKPSIPTATSDLTNDSGFITASDVPAAQTQADWTETSTSSPAYIQHKPDMSQYATQSDLAGKQDVLTAGNNITIENNVISADAAPQLQSNWTENDSTSVQYIQNKPVEKSLVAGTNISITEGTTDVTISATAAPQVQSDWTQSDMTDPSYILHKPTIPSGVQLVPAATSADADKVLTVDSLGVPGWAVVPAQPTGLFQATYGTTTYNEVRNAVTANKIVYCYVSGRMAFLAYVGSTNYEFQYYRSNSSSSGTDSIFVYKVYSSGWETTERTVKAGNISYPVTKVNVNGASAMTGTVANITIPAAPTVDQHYDAQSSNPQSGTAVAEALSGTGQVPTVTSSDDSKVLTATYSGGQGSYSWQPASASTQVNADWEATSGVAEILHKPDLSVYAETADLATVATTGSYDDLSDKPTVDQSYNALSTNAQSGTAVADALTYINQVPNTVSANTGDVLTVDQYGDAAWAAPSAQAQVQADWTESDPNEVSYIQHKPSQKPLVAGQNVVLTEGANSVTIDCTASGGGSTYTAGNGISISAQDVISVDTSVVATQTDLAGKQDTLTAGTNVSITNNVISATDTTYSAGTGIDITNNEISVETPVDIVAGPGIVIDNPDGNTLRVSQAYPTDETVLYQAATDEGTILQLDQYVTLSESMTHFERIRIYYSVQKPWAGKGVFESYMVDGDLKVNLHDVWYREQSGFNVWYETFTYNKYTDSNLRFTQAGGVQRAILNTTWNITSGLTTVVYKIVGVHRIVANN